VGYQHGDDPQLLSDLRTALKRWHRPTLGDVALADGLVDVQRRLAAEPGLTRSHALRQSIRTALASLQDKERAEEADLLRRRYLRGESVTWLTDTYGLSERSIYHRLHEARLALAHALWAQEQVRMEAAPESLLVARSSATLSRARHLPPQTYARLFGMDAALAKLLDYLQDHDGHWVISLDGMAGLGKTALAREAVGRLAKIDRFADIAWVTVGPGSYTSRGPHQVDLPALTCGQVLDSIAKQLAGNDLSALPLPAKRDRVREMLDAGSCLVVLDNLETAMDCGSWPDWFWDMANPSKFLLTSRHWLESDVGPSVLSLDQLAEPHSLALVRREAHQRGLRELAEAGDDALRPILAVTGGNPLAIKLVVGQLVSLPLDHVLAAVETAQAGMDPLYQYLYRVSWDVISEPSRQLLLRMARLLVSTGTWEDLAAASGLSRSELASAIEDLTAHSLLLASGFEVKTYSLHPLTYYFATSLATHENEAEETTA
jgi:hypothetical protein